MADDGIRYLRPEVALLYKAALHRPKDDRDLAVTWPLLGRAERRTGCARPFGRRYPDHPWLERMG